MIKMGDNIGTKQKQTWEIKTWRGLKIREHYILNENGTEMNLLENCEYWERHELKVIRG